jgi:hypothetical protein
MATQISLHHISKPNVGWGICGFCSMIAALHKKGIVSLGDIPEAYLPDLELSVVFDYLEKLQSENSPLLWEIQDFTQAFEHTKNFSVIDYLHRRYAVVINEEDAIGAAMPIRAVMDFLKRQGASPYQLASIDESKGNTIIGLGTGLSSGPRGKWQGLAHWVYMYAPGFVYQNGEMISLAALKKKAEDLAGETWVTMCQIGL